MEKRELFHIGEVARMFHLSVSSLRHYERIGLLQPEYIEPRSGYRYYSIRQFECLNTIRYLRMLDMPLMQISDFLKNRDIATIQELLQQQKEEVIRRQKELQMIERKISNRLRQLENALASEFDRVQIERTPPLRIAWIRNTLSIRSYLDLETSIRQLEEGQKDTAVFLGKVGVGIAKEKLLKKQYDSYDMVFLLLEPEDRYEGKVEELPEETCVSVRFCGSHREATLYYQKLERFLEEHRLMVNGFSREITMIDYGITSDTSQFVTEIQIPIATI
ncbi:MAG: MerR family transcriptional regulator [bacterium]|nr:MerR family transcriptional regulator [bacterium]